MAGIAFVKKNRVSLKARLPVNGAGLNKGHPLNKGLQIWLLAKPWMFGSSTWYDIVDNNNASLVNCGYFTNANPPIGWGGTDRVGGAGQVGIKKSFNAYGEIPRKSILQIPREYTASAWVKPTSLNAGDAGIIGSWFGSGWMIYLDGTGFFRCYVDGTSAQGTGVAAITNQRWYHVCGTWDGNTISIYVNGILANTASQNSITNNNANIIVGSYGGRSSDLILDDIRFWNRCLSFVEVSYLHANSFIGYPGLFKETTSLFFITSSSAITKTLSPAYVQWKNQTLSLIRILSIANAQIKWQASTIALTRSFFLSPAQEQWQASALLLARGLVISPAQEQWRTQTLALTRALLLSPAQEQWRTFSIFSGGGSTFTLTPARVQWMAQQLGLTRGLMLSPAQEQWRTFSIFTGGGSTLTLAPSRLQWMAQQLGLARGLVLSPAQEQWRAQAEVLTRGLVLSPAQEQWRAQAEVLTRSLVLSPAKEQWRAQAEILTRGLLLSPAQEEWRAQSLAFTRGLVISPAQEQWQAQALRNNFQLLVTLSPSRLLWQAETLPLTRGFIVTPAQIEWAAEAFRRVQGVIVSPAQMEWYAQTLSHTGGFVSVLSYARMASELTLSIQEQADFLSLCIQTYGPSIVLGFL